MEDLARQNAKQTIQETIQPNIVSSKVREINQNKHLDLEMLKTLPEDDDLRTVSIIDKVTKYFSKHEDIKK